MNKLSKLKRFREIRLSFVILMSVCLVLFGLDITKVQATDVGGVVDIDTTWTLSGSPYIVLTPVLVYEDVTLTIEPGVVVKFNNGGALQIRGALIAQGTIDLPITFTSNTSPANPGDWDYIFFTDSSESAVYDPDDNYVSGSILEYVVIEYAGGSSVDPNAALRLDRAAPFINHTTVRFSAANGIYYFNGGQNDLRIAQCTISENAGCGVRTDNSGYTLLSESIIENNASEGASLSGANLVVTGNTVRGNQAGGIYAAGSPIMFSSNLITGNTCPYWEVYSTGISGDPAEINRNLIVDNQGCGGMNIWWSRSQVVNNIISDNGGAGLGLAWGASYTVMHNAILRNSSTTETSIPINLDETSTISNNTFMGNTSIGYPHPRTVFIEGGNPGFTYNNIYDNSGYAFWNNNPQGSPDIDASNNWWGTNETELISALIYDWFDDSSLGIVDFSPYQTLHNLDAPISPPSDFSLTPTSTSFILNWAANPESDLVGYKVYYDTDSGYPYTGTGADQGNSPIDIGNTLELTLTGLEQGVRYYFAVTAYDVDSNNVDDQTDGHESWFSVMKSAGMGLMPVADFTASPTSGSAPLQVTFANLSTGDFTACLWDFGDGSTSFNCNDPIHTYENGGTYTVRLTVVGLPGESSLNRPGYVNVIVEQVQAEFSASPASGIAPLAVNFTNQSTGTFDTCAWDFGDWGTSEECDPPNHTYMDPGVYTVSLTVSGLGGTDILTREEYIHVHEPVQAEFSADPTSGIPPLEVFFYNQSSGAYDTCAWDFGDGGTSDVCYDPTHTYLLAGNYTVSLIVSGPGGTDTQTRMDYISVYAPVQAKFSASPTHGIAPLQVDFANESTGDFNTCAWDFGDGVTSDVCNDPTNTYLFAGNYTVSLTINGPGGEANLTETNYIIVEEDAGCSVFLPLILRGSPTPVMPPNAPILNKINNDDGNGNYPVSWSASAGAETYTLQEATDSNFANASTVYSGPNTFKDISGRDVGTYYYRVRAENASGQSDWSNIQSVVVTVPFVPEEWKTITTPANGYNGTLALGSHNRPHISFALSSAQVGYVYWDGNDWFMEIVDTLGSFSKCLSPAMALDENNRPRIAYPYLDSSGHGYLAYAEWDGNMWQKTYKSFITSIPYYTAIALTGNGDPCISYLQWEMYASYDWGWGMRYLCRTGTDWGLTNYVDKISSGLWNDLMPFHSLALGSDGMPHFSYYKGNESSEARLSYKGKVDGIWVSTTVERQGVGSYSSLALNSQDFPHISYYDHTNGYLKYAKWDGNIWHVETVDSNGNVGSWTSLALDGDGHPHISYIDATNHHLKYAFWDGSQWQIEVIDDSGKVWRWTSLALDDSGFVHISYQTYGGLKYATNSGFPGE